MAIAGVTSIALLFAILAINCSAEMSEALKKQFSQNSGHFASDLYEKIIESNPGKNVIFSPFSIQTCVALAHAGAAGVTAEEMAKGVRLVNNDRKIVASTFQTILDAYVDSPVLKIANKFYVKSGYEVQDEFKEIATKNFHSGAENIDFSKNVESAGIMNNWVEKNTNGKIKDLISPDTLDDDTRMVLINAVHFKGEWSNKFKESMTKKEDFWLNDHDTVQVDMMNTKAKFFYADLPEYDATVLLLPYKKSKLSMMILLPNSKTGLKDLEKQLKNIDLLSLKSKMDMTEVVVKLPKFKVEFEIQLADELQKLGMNSMFSTSADFSNLLKTPEPLAVSKVIHKAFIEVNEEGTEAAAATASNALKPKMGGKLDEKNFYVDRPFLYFVGSVQQHFITFFGNVATL